MLNRVILFFLENKPVVWLLLAGLLIWGISTSPFNFNIDQIPKDAVAVDAIPDLGENQQIIFTNWTGRSPQDVEDQVTYPLTTTLLGLPGVKDIRSNSMFGFSSIYLIFNEDMDFYESRSRILEKLNSLPPNTLPNGVQPTLGPDATGLGQVFWYTLEGRDSEGNVTGGWDLHELRSIQDFQVRYALSAVEGVSEVFSIGGHIQEYQIDADPVAMKAKNISLAQLAKAIKESNLEIGARTLEINLAEYFVRGLGYIKTIEDIEESIVAIQGDTPIRIKDIAHVNIGPAARRGILDKSGAEVVGGGIIARYGTNPMAVINNTKLAIDKIKHSLPSKVLADGRTSQLTIVPFYDRSTLINQTIGTLQEALTLEILITMIVILLMLFDFKSSVLVAGSLPVGVLVSFIAMRHFNIDANIVSLSGIAIAIGTMVDMGIVLTESINNRIEEYATKEKLTTSIYEASKEVSGALLTAIATTVVSFLPVFAMEAAEGKLFRPLAYTKTFALLSSILIAITILPALADSFLRFNKKRQLSTLTTNIALFILGLVLLKYSSPMAWLSIFIGIGGTISWWSSSLLNNKQQQWWKYIKNGIYALFIAYFLAIEWMPLGVDNSVLSNTLFIVFIITVLLVLFSSIIIFYENILGFLLRVKWLFLITIGGIIYTGFTIFQSIPTEFMPKLDEGSFLLMPSSMPHAGIVENKKNLQLLDIAVSQIPEIESVVGKAGRVNSAIDPAPLSMFENIINYKPEYKTDKNGHRIRFRVDEEGNYLRDSLDQLIPDRQGKYFRQWRDHIQSPDDIWQEIQKVSKFPGLTAAPKLQPIETRLIMLQTGMRAPMGIKIKGNDLKALEQFGLALEQQLQAVEGVRQSTIFAERIVGKPYLLIDIDRKAIARHGLSIQTVQNYISTAVGGQTLTTTTEGRERYAVRLRYPRELREDPDAIQEILIPNAQGAQIPLGQLVDIHYEQGPQSIKSENGFLVSYVLFDKEEGYVETELIERIQAHLDEKVTAGSFAIPRGINYEFAGNYQQQLRANKRLAVILPIAMALILLILYLHFRSISLASMVFGGVAVAFSGGFIFLWLYAQPWFLDIHFAGTNMRDIFQVHPVYLSVAVWVGFLALFGIATDDGVLVGTFLKDKFNELQPQTKSDIHRAVIQGGKRRVRPAMMTTATTILALLPVLSSNGKGAEIMIPMAIPSLGGMLFQVVTLFTVPILFAIWKEGELFFSTKNIFDENK